MVDDVERYGPLDSFSAFSFESFLGRLKKLVCKPDLPLAQIVYRVAEKQKLVRLPKPPRPSIVVKGKHRLGPLPLQYSDYSQFSIVNYNNMCFSVKTPDNCVKIGNKVYLIQNILCNDAKLVKIVCESFGNISSYFAYPLPSSDLDIHKVSGTCGTYDVFSLSDIKFKYFRLPLEDDYVVVPLVYMLI